MVEIDLSFQIRKAKRQILNYLEDGSCKRREIEKHVIRVLSHKLLKDGSVVWRRKPIHSLAFILAYKELESASQIKIERPNLVPFPMTDFETLFCL